MRNQDILPEHANHPGWSADGCAARIVVSPRGGSPNGGGFACGVTGGHCLPGEKCDARRVSWMEFEAQEAMVETMRSEMRMSGDNLR